MLTVRNTGNEPIKVGRTTIEPGGLAKVELSPDQYRELCVNGPLAVMPDGLVDEAGDLQLPPRDVLERLGLPVPNTDS